MVHLVWLAAGISCLAMATSPLLAASSGDPLAAYRGRSRVLVVVAPEASDARLVDQRQVFKAMRTGARERNLVLVEGIGPSAAGRALRARFAIGPSDFRAILIGKDGGDKLTSATPLGPEQLFPLIDSMPMRQDQMRRRKS